MAKKKDETQPQAAAPEMTKEEREREAQKEYQATYDLKRKAKPRLSGYIEPSEEQLILDTMALSPYNSKKETIIAAVAHYKAELQADNPKMNYSITEDELSAITMLVTRCSGMSGALGGDIFDAETKSVQDALNALRLRNDIVE